VSDAVAAELSARLRGGAGDSTHEALLQFCLDQDLSITQAYKAIAKAKAEHAKRIDATDREAEVATVLARYEHAYGLAIKLDDPTAACKALAGICSLLGLKS
jgi:hypothetical protein